MRFYLAEHGWRHFGALVAWLCCCALLPETRAERLVNARTFTAADGLSSSSCVGVTVSPRGNVWVKHSDSGDLSVYDGYTIRTLPSPGRSHFRVYESRTGQLWTLYSEGLLVYDGSQWVQHPVPQIRAEIQADPLRQVRQIPLLPAERDRVLFLLSDQLMEYQAGSRQVHLLRRSADLGLGRFNEMSESRDGGLWISAERGMARAPGPLRQLNAASAWQAIPVDESLLVENLQRPFEDASGRIVTVAADRSSSSRRALLLYEHGIWTKAAVPGENLRQAWPGWDETFWSFTLNTLLRLSREPFAALSKESIWAGQFKDIAVETNGVFWVASSEGLLRYAPYSWRSPIEVEPFDGLVHSILEDPSGRLWFGSTQGLIRHADGLWERFSWPDHFEADFGITDSLYAGPGERLAIAAQERPLWFDPVAQSFETIRHPEGRTLRLIGQFRSGALCFQTADGAFPAERYWIERWEEGEFQRVAESGAAWQLGAELLRAYEDQGGDLWLAGSEGVGRLRNQELTMFDRGTGFEPQRVVAFIEPSPGKIWCAGSDKIQEFNGRAWTVVRNGLERVTRMTRSRDGKIWVATARGVIAFSDDGSWVLNGPEEGLPSPVVLDAQEDSRGKLWAGTARGISLYSPETDTTPPRTLPPGIEAPAGKPHGTVTLQFRGMDKWNQTPAERLLYSYRVDEGAWSPYTNAPAVTLSRVGAGLRRFEVRAMDRNWNMDPSTAFVELSMVVPWYQEPRLIAVSVAGLVLILFFAGLAVNRHLQLIRSYSEVEQIVTVRTRELEQANQELLHSQKMRALGTLAAGIAHDFNNILSIVKGSAQIIETNLDDPEKVRTRVSRIKAVVDQGAGVVKSMLGLSRVTEKDYSRCDVREIMQQVSRLLGDRFLPGVRIQIECPRGLPPVLTVRELMQQMLLNLVLNAADAMGGTGTIHLRAARLEGSVGHQVLQPAKSAEYVFIEVADTGAGIDADILPRIFEPFFTTKAFSTRRGTGLGLSMVYELAKEMGYGLQVRSEPGQGSRFTILVPIQKEAILSS